MHPSFRTLTTAGAVVLTAGVSACGTQASGDNASGSGDSTSVNVTATDSHCKVADTTIPAGTVTLAITNDGTQVTEVYVYTADNSIVTERENIGPGTSADLTVQLDSGTYDIACVPGMSGKGIRQQVKVTGSRQGQASSPKLDHAVKQYRTWVEAQVEDTLTKTRAFAAAVKSGDVEKAKELYAPSRMGWERIEPVAESFGDIDPKVDLRKRDLGSGQKWTGWHRIERALWSERTTEGMSPYANRLVADLEDLRQRIPDARITATSMANGAKELMDEVATTKVTGEEEVYSHTDLWDFAANVAGAKKVYELLRPVVRDNDKELASTLDEEFADVEQLLAKYERGDGYITYTQVSQQQRDELASAVDALDEPLSRLAATVAQ